MTVLLCWTEKETCETAGDVIKNYESVWLSSRDCESSLNYNDVYNFVVSIFDVTMHFKYHASLIESRLSHGSLISAKEVGPYSELVTSKQATKLEIDIFLLLHSSLIFLLRNTTLNIHT